MRYRTLATGTAPTPTPTHVRPTLGYAILNIWERRANERASDDRNPPYGHCLCCCWLPWREGQVGPLFGDTPLFSRFSCRYFFVVKWDVTKCKQIVTIGKGEFSSSMARDFCWRLIDEALPSDTFSQRLRKGFAQRQQVSTEVEAMCCSGVL